MSLNPPINIRLSSDQYLRYSIAAAQAEIPLRTYLRMRLEENDNMIDKLQLMQQLLQQLITPLQFFMSNKSNNTESIVDKSIMLEILILLRQQASSQNINVAQAELKRLGHEIWSSTKAERQK